MRYLLILFITFNFYSQNKDLDKFKNLKIINSITNLPVANTKIFSNDTLITVSNAKGIVTISSSLKNITLRKNYFYDQTIKLDEINDNEITLDSIISYQLDDVVVSKSKNFLDQVYSNFVNKSIYKNNYKFQNKIIRLSTDDKDFVNIDELFVNGYMIKNSNNASLQIYNRYYDLKFYEKNGQKGIFNKDSKSNIIFLNDKTYTVPASFYAHSSFYNILEIHDFFKNQKKYKFEVVEDEQYYSLKYIYTDPIDKFKFDIKIVIDKGHNAILSYNKTLVANKNYSKKVQVVNTTEYQQFFFKKYAAEVILRKNIDNEFEIVNESVNIEYDYINKNIKIPFYYRYVVEPTVPFKFNIDEFVDFYTLIKTK